MKNKLLAKVAQFGGLSSALLLSGCDANVMLLDPKGEIGVEILHLINVSVVAMLIVVVPTILMTLLFAWHYRHTNENAEYLPNWDHSNKIEVGMWGIPILIIIFLGVITYKTCYSLDPYKPLASEVQTKPLHVQVVAEDWKWLFIYPEEGIAVVNQMAMPVNRPVHFDITSDSVLNSFFIPQLGSMVYAMGGMQTQLHLVANHPGDYYGESANFSGRGFSDMKFHALAMSDGEFNNWVSKVRASTDHLDGQAYSRFAAPSEANPVQYFSQVDPGLFDIILAKYNNGMVMDKSTGKMISVQPSSMSMK